MADNSADIAKRLIIGCVAEGMTIEQACASAGKSIKTYEYYRRTDKVFTDKVDRTRLGLKDKSFASGDVHDVGAVAARSPVGKVTLQRFPDGAKGDLVPGDVGFRKKPGFHGFMTGIKDSAEQTGAVKQVHLTDARHVHDGKEFLQLKLGAGLFVSLAGSAFGGGFTQLHETGR